MPKIYNGRLRVETSESGGNLTIQYGHSVFLMDIGNTGYTDAEKQWHPLSELLKGITAFDSEDVSELLFDYDLFTAIIRAEKNQTELHFIMNTVGDGEPIDSVCWPGAVIRDYADTGCTVLPVMQGMLIYDNGSDAENLMDGAFYSREGTMPWWGQYDAKDGYLAVVDTPFDAEYRYRHSAGESTRVQLHWIPSLGRISYQRSATYAIKWANGEISEGREES